MRTVTLKGVDNIGNVTFIVSASQNAHENGEYCVSGISIASKEEFLESVATYLRAHRAGKEVENAVVELPPDLQSIVDQETDLPEDEEADEEA